MEQMKHHCFEDLVHVSCQMDGLQAPMSSQRQLVPCPQILLSQCLFRNQHQQHHSSYLELEYPGIQHNSFWVFF
uniref:Putative ovule protein n=1 Tax=Solanum chacoense TaxID=4108 RepID=A0A0V0GG77_SOLCH